MTTWDYDAARSAVRQSISKKLRYRSDGIVIEPRQRRPLISGDLWNTIYMDAVLDQLRAEGYPVMPEDEARLSPFGHEHINLLGRYSFAVPEAVARGELRPLRDVTEA